MLSLVSIGNLIFSMVKSSIDKKEKLSHISRIVNSMKVDVEQLREFSYTDYGYVSEELRRQAWPKLLGLQLDCKAPTYDKYRLEKHRDYTQVVLDVNRSLKRFPSAMKEEHRSKLQEQLTTLIMKVLVSNPQLHYYQGFHDICVTFLLTLGKDLGYAAVDSISRSHLRDFMDVDMNRTRSMLNYLYPILERADPEVKAYMEKAEVGTIFSLSWLITWYSHVLDDAKHTVRLYDFFLASHPLMPIYLAVAVVVYRREEVLKTEPEMCFIHVLLSKMPTDLPCEQLINTARTLFALWPPYLLASEANFEYNHSKTIKNFLKFERAIGIKTKEESLTSAKVNDADRDDRMSYASTNLYKVTMWTITAAVGVAVVALQYVVS
ncbi:TBC1 domain family member 20-like isoform X1 [Watersipora subatra]|uniref:TBC1 domain family member 20-like isoform X1 n=1 Tax=Watersipora subatra TaxID=2589382 RepID=UPI00355B48CC